MPPKFLDDWKIVVDWLAAIGTFLAVIVALFAAKIEQLWRGKPNLALIDEQVVVLPPDNEGKAMIILPIENIGTYLAENAEVFIKAVSRRSTSGSYKRDETIVPMSLRWYHSESNKPDIFTTIAPKLQRYCILGALKIAVKEQKSQSNDSTAFFELWTEYKRSQNANELPPGCYQIDLLLAANGMSPQPQKIWLKVPQRFEPGIVKVSIKVDDCR